MPVTMLYAGALGLILLVLSVRVIQARGAQKVYMGDGGNELVLRRMRGHANFAEYVPTCLILLGLLEFQHALPVWVLHALGGSLLVARVLHAYTFAFSTHFMPGRFGGTVLTWAVLGIGAALNLWAGLASL